MACSTRDRVVARALHARHDHGVHALGEDGGHDAADLDGLERRRRLRDDRARLLARGGRLAHEADGHAAALVGQRERLAPRHAGHVGHVDEAARARRLLASAPCRPPARARGRSGSRRARAWSCRSGGRPAPGRCRCSAAPASPRPAAQVHLVHERLPGDRRVRAAEDRVALELREHLARRVDVADPDGRGALRRQAGEPGVLEVARGAGLAGGGPREAGGASPVPTRMHAAHRVDRGQRVLVVGRPRAWRSAC